MSRILSLDLSMEPSHTWEPAWGPRKNPSSFAKGATLKSAHSRRLFLSHFFMESCTLGVNMHKGTSTHLIGFKAPGAHGAQLGGWGKLPTVRQSYLLAGMHPTTAYMHPTEP